MNEKNPDGGSADHATLRRASLKVAVRISAACAVMVLCLLAGAAFYLMNQLANPEIPGSGAPATDYAYLDAKDLLKALIIAGAAGIVLAGGIGWASARSAIRPLAEALALQRRFVQDASHELRTPLAILDSRIQLAQREAAPDSKPGKALARIREDTAALTSIVNELLLAATGAAQEPSAEPTDLADVAESVAEGMQQMARNQGVSIVARAQVRPLARIDKGSLRRAVLALADNALAHTPSGGAITITAVLERHHAVITVSDTGTGIDGVDQARIFERFVRTHGRHGTRRSFGIGLALVRDIVSSAGGTVEIARTGPDGTTMRIALPPAEGGIPDRRVVL
ncbi:HAMP domain-containing histidine kinase [Arthrobacter sp. 24S4-2]|uniref:sensor histidine kinase n=1 Tax=Arthrobacter sp. 24S4-2 TaxID=2575374 RepID=UPI0010C7B014|nr:HAMP domain-containing sensor histidine kinase [Arthrobacter sp. 24S4-2]QCO98501.1 HAMP domain-containing histidine kinase [Arthrobacter sp. 24S4-2]